MFFGWKSEFCLTLFMMFVLLVNPLAVLAQESSGNAIFLEIPRVTKGGQTVDTKADGVNKWVFDGELNKDDEIRYRWNAVSLDLRYKDSPAVGGGYLKIYKNNDSTEDNLLTEFGSSPLPIGKVADKLENGQNKLLFVYIDSTSGKPANPLTKVSVSFGYKNESIKPVVRVLEPQKEALLAAGVNQGFRIELENFKLSETNNLVEGQGKMNIYEDEIVEDKLIATVKSSVDFEDRKSLVEFSTKDVDFSQIADSGNKKILFVLTDGAGKILPYQNEVILKSNYNNSVDVGLPKVRVVEPRKDRSDLSMDGNQKILLEIENFEILESFEEGENQVNKGYLQIFVDDSPIKTIWPKLDFSLNEIGYYSDIEGIKSIKLQLVNKNFTKLVPEVMDTFDLIYIAENKEDKLVERDATVSSDRWRVIIIIFIVVMIVGGISILVLKG
ncbi:hypothetical protein HC864_05695 [Candidatus Gracilibacteria bacterium]|nr:hypothetical protein [Candidatus Gracilibacteria bacterium]